MANDLGLLKNAKDIHLQDEGEKAKIERLKALINALHKGTIEKNNEEYDGGKEGGSGKGRNQNFIRFISSAIKNKVLNLSDKNEAMNLSLERLHLDSTPSSSSSSSVSLSFTSSSSSSPLPSSSSSPPPSPPSSSSSSSSSPVPYFSSRDGLTGNTTIFESPEVLLDDIDAEPLAENSFLNFLNGSFNIDRRSDKIGRNFTNRTIYENRGESRNDSFGSNFDFFTSLYNYNAAELLSGSTDSNISSFVDVNSSERFWNKTNLTLDWDNHKNSSWDQPSPMAGNYWALILIVFPFLTLFGNVLVILAVVRERTLQTATNYFIVSLALADLLVAVLVMPFAVYVLVNGAWSLPSVVCDFYIAMDVTCSTSSIFNLVAISIDRYIAVTQPIKYAKHKNTQRVWSTIALVWVISAAIGSPIVLGLNNTPDRLPDLCLFYNSDFIIYSSLSSFYIPCIIMVFLYYNIFKALRNRAKKAKATKKPNARDILPGSVIENVIQTRRLAETALGEPLRSGKSIPLEDERPTNTGSGSNEDEGAERSPGSDEIKGLTLCAEDCEIISNDKSTEFILSTVVEEAAAVVSKTSQSMFHDPNGNNDSGYAASNLEDAHLGHFMSPHHSPPRRAHTEPHFKSKLSGGSPTKGQRSSDPQAAQEKDQKSSSIGTRFTIYKVNKASKKKREKSTAKKERKATKTLAIVLGVFLICWVPFFTCNILDALCTKLSQSCQPGVAAFILTTWLGYFNSFVNPVIYTIFNPEFRKAFKKIMSFQN